TDTKVVYSVYDDEFPGQLDPKYSSKLLMDGISKSSVDIFREPTYENLTRGAIAHSDGVIIGSENINTEIHGFIATQDIPVLSFQNDDSYIDAYSEFYEEVMVSEEVYSD
ncbi:MAG: glycogen synthase, partial [Bacteroidetes bacterium]|nr:glycogen synthase [Bacteroidota bacterium]